MAGDTRNAELESVIMPRTRDLGDGFEVRRALPSAQRRTVGPFVFFDQMGPVMLPAGRGLDVRPHPHIGLATVTYLFDGEALPKGREEMEPGFAHHGADALPVIEGEGKRLRLIAGSLYGERAPVEVFSEMFYADATLSGAARLDLPAEHEERAAWVAEGRIEVGGDVFDAGQMLVFRPGDAVAIKALDPARLILFGGEPMDGPRHVWWNFVSSSAERIEQAKADWKAARFGKVPGDETEFIPLPEE